MTIQVFLISNHPIFLAGLQAVLANAATLAVAGEAASGADAAYKLSRIRPSADIVLMDLQLADSAGIETIQAISTGAGNGTASLSVLVVSTVEDDDVVIATLRAGARGFLSKTPSPEELVRAIHIVADGGAVFSSPVADRFSAYFSAVRETPSRAAFPELTDRELQVLDLIARGYNNQLIARRFTLSEKTIRNHVTHIFAKLRVADRAAAIVRARDVGLGV
jgi:DNA-binding NarL/FixJ family response regulator